jgi:O-antigen ligase
MLKEGAGAARVEIWNALSELISKKPITGYGVNTTRELTLPSDNIFRNFQTILHPHNLALQIWLELGFIGVLVSSYVLWCVIGFIENISQFFLRLNALGVFIAWISISAVGYGMWQSWWVGLTLTLVLFYALLTENNKLRPSRTTGHITCYRHT